MRVVQQIHWMTNAQIWWKILRVYTENIKYNFGLEFIVRVEQHELSIRMQ